MNLEAYHMLAMFVQHQAAGISYIPLPPKNCCPKLSHVFVYQKQPKTEQSEQQFGQSCQKTNFKTNENSIACFIIYMSCK